MSGFNTRNRSIQMLCPNADEYFQFENLFCILNKALIAVVRKYQSISVSIQFLATTHLCIHIFVATPRKAGEKESKKQAEEKE